MLYNIQYVVMNSKRFSGFEHVWNFHYFLQGEFGAHESAKYFMIFLNYFLMCVY